MTSLQVLTLRQCVLQAACCGSDHMATLPLLSWRHAIAHAIASSPKHSASARSALHTQPDGQGSLTRHCDPLQNKREERQRVTNAAHAVARRRARVATS